MEAPPTMIAEDGEDPSEVYTCYVEDEAESDGFLLSHMRFWEGR